MKKADASTDAFLDWPAKFDELSKQARHPALQRFYRAGVVAAQTPVEHVNFLALDVETTGLDAQADSIVSIGLLPFTLRRIQCQHAHYQVVRPASELSGKSVTFHHITHAEVANAPTFEVIYETLLTAMAGKVMVVHYRNIERAFLNRAFMDHVGEGLQFPVIDTMQLEARLHRQKLGWLGRLLRRPQLSIRLADSRARYNLPMYHAHHALTDALAAAELLQAQVATHHGPTTSLGSLWS
ncbi:3'-5' exonuclease [Pseudomonas syringae pv. dysoxyli]|uniref:3'-5' exonuclease n=1 Tax=Pseudomonas syringae TaxID=317 RepID=UPI0013725025|nr:3'-5' exonuclease [Pseudomonas syringae]NAO30073.1 3'-5' exonuclease [Pseudomonas syringae pv. dysoxyli]